MLSRLLYLQPGQLQRAAPFFALYLVLFAGLTLADGVATTLVLGRLGAAVLPGWYATSAVCVMVVLGMYLLWGSQLRADAMFVLLLGLSASVFAGLWCSLSVHPEHPTLVGWLLVGRELAFALVLLHFGAYLQEYFTRAALSRVMPVVYAGGRLGGIAGAIVLQAMAPRVDPVHMLPIVAGTMAIGCALVVVLGRSLPTVAEPDGSGTASGSAAVAWSNHDPGWSMLWREPLLRWISLATLVYFAARTFLAYRHNEFVATAFTHEADLAAFLGRYTQWALIGSLLVQLLLINRAIHWFGLRGVQCVYATLVLIAALTASWEMTFATAIFARLVEGELRFCVRNPVAQLTLNQFSRAVRTRARAWSLGLLIPLATFLASAGLGYLLRTELAHLIPLATALLGLGFFLATAGLICHISAPSPTPSRSFDIPATSPVPSSSSLRAVSSVG